MNSILQLLVLIICGWSLVTAKPFLSVEPVGDSAQNCPPQPAPQDLPSDLPDDISKALEQIGNLGTSFLNPKTLPAIAISVTYMGETLWSKGLGVKSKDDPNHTPPDGDTIFRIGSVSKIFPVTMIYQLYEDGYVQSLDDPIIKYAPDFSIINPFSNRSVGITLRQMASQLSGLQRESPCTNSTEEKVCQMTTQEMLKILSLERLIHPPWTKPSYSNLAYALLGRLMVRLVNKDMKFEDYVYEKILKPLEMANTGFDITDEVKSKMAVGYMLDGSVAPLTDLGWSAPAGQMYSTINDLNKLSKFFYEAYPLPHNDGAQRSDSVLRADTRREMALPYFINPDRQTGFGTPWEIMYRGNYTIRTKGGNVDGYSALFSFIPELHLGINALFSGGFEGSLFASKAFDILLPPFVSYLSSLPPKLGFPPNPEVYTGTFVGEGVQVIVFAKDNVLYGRSGNRTESIDYWEPNRMQIYFDESLYPCMDNELLGEIGEWIYYDSEYRNGMSPGFAIPGRFPGVHFKREE